MFVGLTILYIIFFDISIFSINECENVEEYFGILSIPQKHCNGSNNVMSCKLLHSMFENIL